MEQSGELNFYGSIRKRGVVVDRREMSSDIIGYMMDTTGSHLVYAENRHRRRMWRISVLNVKIWHAIIKAMTHFLFSKMCISRYS